MEQSGIRSRARPKCFLSCRACRRRNLRNHTVPPKRVILSRADNASPARTEGSLFIANQFPRLGVPSSSCATRDDRSLPQHFSIIRKHASLDSEKGYLALHIAREIRHRHFFSRTGPPVFGSAKGDRSLASLRNLSLCHCE